MLILGSSYNINAGDGIFDRLEDKQIASAAYECLSKENTGSLARVLEAISSDIIKIAYNAGSTDNLTSITVALPGIQKLIRSTSTTLKVRKASK